MKDKAFRNLNSSELQQKGATFVGRCFVRLILSLFLSSVALIPLFHFCSCVERLSGLPVHIRGNVFGGSSEISKAHFSKLLKQARLNLWVFYALVLSLPSPHEEVNWK